MPGERVLIVGCGRIAGGYNEADEQAVLTHAVAYRRLGASLVGCCDVDADRAQRFARRWQVERWGTDLGQLLADCQPEVVSVCTPPVGRLPQVRVAVEAPSVRAVLVEKPLATNGAEARAIQALAGKPLLVNFPRAFDPFYLRLQREAGAGTLGPLRQGVARYYGPALTNATHWIERLLAMFGPPRTARRTGGTVREPILELDFAGAEVLLLPTVECQYAPFELELLFERQRLRVIDSERRAEHFQSMPDPAFPGFFNLVRTPAWDGAAPSHEAVGQSVEAALRLAAGQPIEVDWRALLERAATTVGILESAGAQ